MINIYVPKVEQSCLLCLIAFSNYFSRFPGSVYAFISSVKFQSLVILEKFQLKGWLVNMAEFQFSVRFFNKKCFIESNFVL